MSILEAITTHKNNTRAALTKEFGRIDFISDKLSQEELTSDDIKGPNGLAITSVMNFFISIISNRLT